MNKLEDLIDNCWPAVVAGAAGLLVVMLIDHYINVYSYWPRHGIKGDQPVVPIVAEFWNYFVRNQLSSLLERRQKYGKIYGTFFLGRKRLVVNDPEVFKQIAVRDFNLFPDHKPNYWLNRYERNNLFWIQGDHWRRVRALMSPTFTSTKMKRMFKLMDCNADDLVENFREQYIEARRAGEKCAQVDLMQTFGMYTMDGITTCCYGIKLKRQSKTSLKVPKYKYSSSRESFAQDINMLLVPKLSRVLMFEVVPNFILRALKVAIIPESSFKPVLERLQKMIDMRRQSESSGKYEDLLQLLVDAKLEDTLELNEMDQAENHHAELTQGSLEHNQNKLKVDLGGQADTKTTLSDFEILAEATLLLSAGYETTRISMSSIVYFLAHNPKIQERLYEEVKSVAQYTPTAMGEHLVFDYESLTACQYLDAVISESLRMFPPAPFTEREAKQDYYVEKYNLTIPKGVSILFAFYSMHMDPDYWEEPEKFDPDRFMPGRREKIVSGSYAPFSIGPRYCIGMRFSLTETKLGLAKIVMNFKFEPATNSEYPPVAEHHSFGLVSIRNCRTKVLLRDA